MLDPTLLRSFVMVVDAGNFTRAGEWLHLTQSTVSQQILRLEEQLGCRLLERGRRQVHPSGRCQLGRRPLLSRYLHHPRNLMMLSPPSTIRMMRPASLANASFFSSRYAKRS